MLDRRDFIRTCSGLGLAGTLFPGVLWAQAQAQGAKKITKEMIENAAVIADVPIADDYKEMMLENLNGVGARAGGTGSDEEGFVHRTDGNVPGTVEKE